MLKACNTIKTITTSAGKEVVVAYVTKTDVWERTFLSPDVQNEFAAVAEKYKDTLKPETVKVAMKETEHPDKKGHRTHYSAIEIDENEEVVASKHYRP
ncbi:hypothetical protein FQN50_003751 [Emmonsiellopsis sp. PD_5]|nr:hypothetical protein FQN50_003751 [Emmonsiellopsis sp. PD_5]